MKNISISLGNYFDEFVSSLVSAALYINVSEIIRAGLRFQKTNKVNVLF